MLVLHPPTAQDVSDLLAFETTNREYFERNINARPSDYYSEQGVARTIDLALREAEERTGYQYLVRDEAGALVGRVNLKNVRRAHFHCAELGYRIAQAAAGKGYATKAVDLALRKASTEHGLIRVEATARPENTGSIKVLVRNGFTEFGRSTRSVEISGVWYDLLHFERRLDA